MRLPALVLTSLVSAFFVPAALAQQGVGIASGGALTDFTTWTLAGSATAVNDTPGNGFAYSLLRLTQSGTGDQAGSGFAPVPLWMDFNQPFYFDFNFFIPVSANDVARGDGMTFTLATAADLGNGGSDLGYGGIGNSVAFAIDTFHFGGQPVSPSLQILTQGSTTPVATTLTGLGDTIRDANFQWFASVSYLPSGNDDEAGTLTGFIQHPNLGSFAVSASVDFNALGLAGSEVYYGFTASNGLATDGHFVTSAVPVPEPASWALMALGLLAVAGRTMLRRLD